MYTGSMDEDAGPFFFPSGTVSLQIDEHSHSLTSDCAMRRVACNAGAFCVRCYLL